VEIEKVRDNKKINASNINKNFITHFKISNKKKFNKYQDYYKHSKKQASYISRTQQASACDR
jgi:hypothetical protein